MANLPDIQNQFVDLVTQTGKATLHALFPNDFSFSAISLELVDSQGITVDFFTYPILPDEIRETHQEITTIRKTMGGVNVLKNPTFTTRQISMRGTFGRTFKLLLGQQTVEFAGFGFSIQNGKFKVDVPNLLSGTVPQFSTFAKTGYGCVKIIESMKEKSKQLDQYQKPYSLYLYNPILGNNYQVEVNSFSHMQDKDQYNMIPAYTLNLTAVAPLDSILGRRASVNSALKNLSLANLQKTANTVASGLRLIEGI